MPHTVMLAEDNAEIRLLMRYLLEADGRFAVVGEATNGREAIDLAQTLLPDALIIDLSMPLVDGFQAIPALRTVSPQTKILVFSALATDDVADRVHAAGAHAFLQKPTGARNVASKLAELCTA